MVKEQKDLMSTPVGVVRAAAFFQKVKNVNVLNETEVLEIDRARKRVRVRQKGQADDGWLDYDKLVLATGAQPVVPPIPNVKLENIFTLHGVHDAEAIKRLLAQVKARDVVMIGGGLMGVETTEALVQSGCRVTLVEMLPQVLRVLVWEPAWLVGGFLVMFFLQRFLPFHHHDVAEGSPPEPCGHTYALAERSARSLSWLGVALGLSLHSIFDGLAMAAAVASGKQGHSEALGLGTALAVILHKPFGALAITTLMAATGAARSSRHLVNLAFALVTPLGALLFYLGAGPWMHTHPAWLGCALAFCAGTFLCIACADLLPELQFHTHDRFKLSLALLAGLAVAVGIGQFGHADHSGEHPAGESAVVPQNPQP